MQCFSSSSMYMYFLYIYTGIYMISDVHWRYHGCLVIFSSINHYYHHHAVYLIPVPFRNHVRYRDWITHILNPNPTIPVTMEPNKVMGQVTEFSWCVQRLPGVHKLATKCHRGGKSTWPDQASNPGPLADCASTLTTELPSHTVDLWHTSSVIWRAPVIATCGYQGNCRIQVLIRS